jgi:hypothetical protein
MCNCEFILIEYSVADIFILVLPFCTYPQIKNIVKSNLKFLKDVKSINVQC